MSDRTSSTQNTTTFPFAAKCETCSHPLKVMEVKASKTTLSNGFMLTVTTAPCPEGHAVNMGQIIEEVM